MKPLRLALLLGIGGVMRAQDYQPVNSGRIAYFERGGEVRCIRIDSTIFDSDSVLYPFSNVSSFSYECFTPDGPSWIGEKIIVRENGMNLFFNKVQDTIWIDMHAMTGESWIAYRSAAGNIVEATVLDHDTLNFMGLSDSVKTIGFQVYDAGMSPVSHEANNFTVGISKSYGFTKTLNFNLFPDIIEESVLIDQPGEFYLAGLSTPRVGIQNLTWFEVYDFQPDDEIHVVKTRSMFGDPQTCPEYGETIKQTFKYLDRSDYPDSIIYTVEIGMNRDQNWEDSSAFESSHDTIITVIHRNPQFDHLPGEPVIADFSFHVYGMVTGELIQKTETEPRMVFDYSGDDCWALPIYDGCMGTTRYIKGLGGPFSSCSGGLDC
ncbi:MAG: hypothetical protein EHM46_04135, partial [Bacteroidetes bacterium]